MEVEYWEKFNCYVTKVELQGGSKQFRFRAVIDTGASNTTLSLEKLVGGTVSKKMLEALDKAAQKADVRRAVIRGATAEPDIKRTYTYDACFKNVMVGEHYMKEFHLNILINGAKDIFVLGNDFLNMCNYQHKAGERCLVIGSPYEQKYYESFAKKSALNNEQLNMLLFNPESKEEAAISEEDDIGVGICGRIRE